MKAVIDMVLFVIVEIEYIVRYFSNGVMTNSYQIWYSRHTYLLGVCPHPTPTMLSNIWVFGVLTNHIYIRKDKIFFFSL